MKNRRTYRKELQKKIIEFIERNCRKKNASNTDETNVKKTRVTGLITVRKRQSWQGLGK